MKNQATDTSKKNKKTAPFKNGATKNGSNNKDTAGLRNPSPEMTEGTFVKHADAHFNLKPAIGLKANKLERISQILNKTLSNQHVLYIKTRNYHWNLVGKRFHTLHLFLEEQYKVLAQAIDDTAERVRVLGGVPKASMAEFLKEASLFEASGQLIEGDEAIANLLRDHQSVVVSLRQQIDELDEKIGDAGTADFLTDLMKVHEKSAWMLRSHLSV